MLNSMAIQKPPTEKPSITDDASKISKALMTKVNKPKVKMLIGRVIKIKIGLTKTLIIPKNKASHKAAQNPATTTPGIKYELIIIAKTMTSHLMIMDINLLFIIYNEMDSRLRGNDKSFLVDLARIGLASRQCECRVIPLDHRPKNLFF